MVGYNPDSSQQLNQTSYAFAGALSGFVTRVVAQPLDVLKIRFQVEPIAKSRRSKYSGMLQASSAILKDEGISAFWKGHVPAQLLSVVYGLVQVYSSLWQSSQLMVEKEGVRALYKGLLPSLAQIAPQNGFQFAFYAIFLSLAQTVLPQRHPSSPEVPGAVPSLVCGSAAGLCSKLLVYPLDLIKKRMEISGFAAGRPITFGETYSHKSMRQCMRRVILEEGLVGLYKGLSPSAVKAAVTAACHFCVYEQTCAALKVYRRQRNA